MANVAGRLTDTTPFRGGHPMTVTTEAPVRLPSGAAPCEEPIRWPHPCPQARFSARHWCALAPGAHDVHRCACGQEQPAKSAEVAA
jgi:hypothetical protein